MTETRLNDADRDRIVASLRHHLGEERLTLEEFEDRCATVFAAESLQAAQAVLADLPAPSPPSSVDRSRGRRHAEAPNAQSHWHRTEERFRDPTSGRIMRVWVDPETTARHYVPD